jgi:hypothetical protein
MQEVDYGQGGWDYPSTPGPEGRCLVILYYDAETGDYIIGEVIACW